MTEIKTIAKADTECKAFTYWQDWDNYEGMFAFKNAKTLDRFKELSEQLRNIDLRRFDMFAAFSGKQFEQGLKEIRPLRDGEKLISMGAGIYGTKDGIAKYMEFANSITEMMTKECDPQEVYVYEFNNYESAIDFDGDERAIRFVASLFGWDVAKTVKRCCALYSIDDLMKDKRD